MADRIPLVKTSVPGIFRYVGKRKTTYTVVIATGTDAKGNPTQVRETFDSFDAAKKWRTKTLHELASNSYVEPSKERVLDYLDRWVDDQRGRVKPVTVLLYRQAVARLAVPLDGVRLCDLDARRIAAMVKTLETAGYAPATIVKTYTVFKSAIADAVRHNLLASNPCARLRGPRAAESDPDAFTETELAAFRAVVAGDRYEVLWETAIETGARFAELAALRWDNVDLDARAIAICENITRTEDNRRVVGTPKTETGVRVVALSDDLVALLRRHRDALDERRRHNSAFNPDDRVFPGDRAPTMSHGWINTCLARLCERAGIRILSFHGLRHTSGTEQIEAGIPTKTVAERLGHANPAYTLRKYVHPDRAAHARAADAMGAHLRRRRGEGVVKNENHDQEKPEPSGDSESE